MKNIPINLLDNTHEGMLKRRHQAAADYPRLFGDLLADWNREDAGDRAWLMYSANYLFRTAGVRWALDPIRLQKRLPEVLPADLEHAFDKLDFVVLSHAHADHLDFDLIKIIQQQFPVRWVIPDFMLELVMANTGLDENLILVSQPAKPFNINGIQFLPMEGHHFTEKPSGGGTRQGVLSMAYLVEFNEKRWFFPGDTRNYQPAFPLLSGALDGIFAHLWLGKGCALINEPLLLDAFCRFCANLDPKQVILTHLEEFGRDMEDFWDTKHVQMVTAYWERLGLQIPIRAARMGDTIPF